MSAGIARRGTFRVFSMAAFAADRSTTKRSRSTMPTDGEAPAMNVPSLNGSALCADAPAWP
jgi:hypothetical protein